MSNVSSPNKIEEIKRPYIKSDLRIHKDHISVLDIDFQTGQLVETYNGDLGIIIESLSNPPPDYQFNSTDFLYKVQVGTRVEYWMAMSLKKVKK